MRIEQSLARAHLHGAARDPIPLKPRRTLAARSERLFVPLPTLGPGSYELRYHVLAADGHTTQGTLRFQVRP